MCSLIKEIICFSLLIVKSDNILFYKRNDLNFVTLNGIPPLMTFKGNINSIMDIIRFLNEKVDCIIMDNNVINRILNTCNIETFVKYIKYYTIKVCSLDIKFTDEFRFMFKKYDLMLSNNLIFNLNLTVKTNFTGNNKMFVHGSFDGISNGIISNGVWESTMTKIICDILDKEKGIIIDVGANIGYYSFISAIKGHKVHSFEPLPYNISLLKLTTELNNLDIIINSFALSDKKHIINLIYDPTNLGFTRVGEGSIVTRVDCDTLDNYVCVNDITDILILKVDIEGHEKQFVEGSIKIIKDRIAKYIFMELGPDLSGHENCINILNLFKDNGYNIYDIENSMFSGRDDVLDLEKCIVTNIVETVNKRGQTDIVFVRKQL